GRRPLGPVRARRGGVLGGARRRGARGACRGGLRVRRPRGPRGGARGHRGAPKARGPVERGRRGLLRGERGLVRRLLLFLALAGLGIAALSLASGGFFGASSDTGR